MHTGRSRVCEVGHAEADSGDYESVCAHAAYWRVQSRTRDRQNGAALVRLCTRGASACAKSDTRRLIQAVSCPEKHTGRPRVCTSGHDDGRGACAPARARGRLPAGPRGRPKRSLRADKGCPRSRFSARLIGRGAPQIAGRHARPAEANPRCARRRSTGRASRWARDEDVREGVRNAQLFVKRPTSTTRLKQRRLRLPPDDLAC